MLSGISAGWLSLVHCKLTSCGETLAGILRA